MRSHKESISKDISVLFRLIDSTLRIICSLPSQHQLCQPCHRESFMDPQAGELQASVLVLKMIHIQYQFSACWLEWKEWISCVLSLVSVCVREPYITCQFLFVFAHLLIKQYTWTKLNVCKGFTTHLVWLSDVWKHPKFLFVPQVGPR